MILEIADQNPHPVVVLTVEDQIAGVEIELVQVDSIKQGLIELVTGERLLKSNQNNPPL